MLLVWDTTDDDRLVVTVETPGGFHTFADDDDGDVRAVNYADAPFGALRNHRSTLAQLALISTLRDTMTDALSAAKPDTAPPCVALGD